jgi:hypothetical protein
MVEALDCLLAARGGKGDLSAAFLIDRGSAWGGAWVNLDGTPWAIGARGRACPGNLEALGHSGLACALRSPWKQAFVGSMLAGWLLLVWTPSLVLPIGFDQASCGSWLVAVLPPASHRSASQKVGMSPPARLRHDVQLETGRTVWNCPGSPFPSLFVSCTHCILAKVLPLW